MITLNLLPDIKRDYLKARATRDRVITWSLLAAGSFVGLVIIASIIIGIQWLIVDSTRDDLDALTDELRGKENIEEVLTVQNQVLALPDMHQDKPKVTRIFSYLSTLTPDDVDLANLETSMDEQTMDISGSADNVRDLNVFVDTLKGARYQLGPRIDEDDTFEDLSVQEDQDFSDMDLNDPEPAFSNVVSSLDIELGAGGVNFNISLSFAPEIFESDYSAVRMYVAGDVDSGDHDSDTIFDNEQAGEEGE